MLLQDIYGVILLGFIHGGLALWIYNDIKLRQQSVFWVFGTLLVPGAFFPLYFWKREPELVWMCPNCYRNNRSSSRKCARCDKVYAEEQTAARLHGYFEPSDACVIILITLLVRELGHYIAMGMMGGTDVLSQKVELSSLPIPYFWGVELIVGNVLIWLCLHCVTVRYRRMLAAVGLYLNGKLYSWIFPLLLAPILVLISEGTMQWMARVNSLISSKGLDALIQWEQQQQVIGMPAHVDASMLLIGFVLLILVPVGEEILFRGIAYTALSYRFGHTKGLLLSALLFAALHGTIIYLIPIFLTGLALALLYTRTKSLIPSIITHSLINLITLMIWFGKG